MTEVLTAHMVRGDRREADVVQAVPAAVAADTKSLEPSAIARRAIDTQPACDARDGTLLAALFEGLRGQGSVAGIASAAARAVLEELPTATHVIVYLARSEESRDLRPVVMRHRDPGAAPRSDPFTVSHALLADAIERRSAFLVADAVGDYPKSRSITIAHVRSAICVPLIVDRWLVGVLEVDQRGAPASLTGRHLDLLTLFGRHLAARLAYAWVAHGGRRSPDRRARAPMPPTPIRTWSPLMEATVRTLDRFAAETRPILICGETGTGKELLARRAHELSDRSRAPFVALNCAAMPHDLVESELFGHVRGAFSGALDARRGLFRAAEGGTLFLDEIGELPLDLQSKLLRALEEGSVRPVGADRVEPVDTRVIAATHQDLLEAAKAGRFRDDLYYRLAVLRVDVPPLRERVEDVVQLARHFLGAYCDEVGRPGMDLTSEALGNLVQHDWPGNVRELRNAVERAAALTVDGATIDAAALRLDGAAPGRPSSGSWSLTPLPTGLLRSATAALERRLIADALRACEGNITHAAERLGLSRQGLRLKMRRYGLRDRAPSS